MARIEKTVFISYRRKDISWALAVYQYLTSQRYDVFFDYTSLSGGDFEQVIVSNIKARAHFVLILTPTALDRCNEPGDWLRREIETAIDEKRNIIPLFFDDFNFNSSAVKEKLTGKMANISRYNGLDIPSGYFMEGMERLRSRYLNMPLNAVLHPVPTQVRKVVKEEKIAADKAVKQSEDIKEIVRPVKKSPDRPKIDQIKQIAKSPISTSRGARGDVIMTKLSPYILGVGIILLAVLGITGVRSLINNTNMERTPSPTRTFNSFIESTLTPTKPIPTSTTAALSFAPTSVPSKVTEIPLDDNLGRGVFVNMTVSSVVLTQRCTPNDIIFKISATNPDIQNVLFYYHVVGDKTFYLSEWKAFGTMVASGNGNYNLSFTANDIHPDLRFDGSFLGFQFVGLKENGDVVDRSEKIDGLIKYTYDCT